MMVLDCYYTEAVVMLLRQYTSIILELHIVLFISPSRGYVGI